MNHKLLSIFNHTTNSYKFYWWLSIIELIKDNKAREFYFDDIVINLIANIWYPVNYFKLSFGKQDQLSKHVASIKNEFNLNDDIKKSVLIKFLKNNNNNKLLIKIINDITRYVPYRFLRSFYSQETRGLNDALVNDKIIMLQDIKHEIPYKINVLKKKIKFSKKNIDWILENYLLLYSFTQYELLKYLEKHNSSIPNISSKLNKPENRKLSLPTKLRSKYISENPNEKDVFENKPFNSFYKKSIDHFMPWSFFTHDKIWNLHPIEHTINCSKSNMLPHKNYLKPFLSLQYNFSRFLLKVDYNKQLEDYYLLFNCSKDEFENIRKSLFVKKMEKSYNPKFEIAINMGYEENWQLT